MTKSNLWYKLFKRLLDMKINSFFNVEIKNKELYNEDKTYYIVANHTSWLDPFLILYSLSSNNTISIVIEKSSAFQSGIIKKIADLVNLKFITVDRADKMSRMVSLRNANRTLKSGQSVLLFPEGRINPDSSRMYPIYKGGFLAATSNKVEILPIKIKGAEKLYKNRNIVIEFGEPISTNKKDNLDEIAINIFYTLRDKMIPEKVENDETEIKKDITMKYLTTLAPPPENLGEPLADPSQANAIFSKVNEDANMKNSRVII